MAEMLHRVGYEMVLLGQTSSKLRLGCGKDHKFMENRPEVPVLKALIAIVFEVILKGFHKVEQVCDEMVSTAKLFTVSWLLIFWESP